MNDQLGWPDTDKMCPMSVLLRIDVTPSIILSLFFENHRPQVFEQIPKRFYKPQETMPRHQKYQKKISVLRHMIFWNPLQRRLGTHFQFLPKTKIRSNTKIFLSTPGASRKPVQIIKIRIIPFSDVSWRTSSRYPGLGNIAFMAPLSQPPICLYFLQHFL